MIRSTLFPMRLLPSAFCLLPFAFLLQPFALANASAPLSFSAAYQDILTNTYEIKAADADVMAKEADRWQAGTYVNPSLSVNLSSIGNTQGGNENQLFVGVTQIFELGGKRAARLRVAEAGQCATQWSLEILKNTLHSELLHAFVTMAAAQERVALAQGQQQVAEQTLGTIATKAVSGKTSGIEERKAHIAFQNAKLVYLKQLSGMQKAKKRLVALWDSRPPYFDTITFSLFYILPPPPLELLKERVHYHPELIQAEAEVSRASELIALERSRRVPDIAIQVGVTTEKFVEQPALNIGFGMPLPFFDRNTGNISRASYEQLEAVYHQMDLHSELQNALDILYQEWVWAYEQAIVLKESILPAAQENLQLAQESYNEGKSDYLNLLDARSTLFNIQQQYLDVIEEYHHKRADIFKVTATYYCETI